MADNLSSVIDYITPAASGISVLTNTPISIIFDREIDETTLSNGNLFVTGPDNDTWSGPDLLIHQGLVSVGEEEGILQSPGYDGVVQGTFSFDRISNSTLNEVDTLDVVGSGFLYRTKVTFTPTNRLQADTEYTVYLSGDEDEADEYSTGISGRTVFDPVSASSETLNISGTYAGTIADSFVVEIETGGAVGTATFSYYKSSAPLAVHGPFKTKTLQTLLEGSVYVSFNNGETYTAGTSWTTVVKPRSFFLGNVSWIFKTGSGSIQQLPETISTSILGLPYPEGALATTSDTFTLTTSDPEDGASHLTITDPFTITLTFSDAVDAATVVSGVCLTVVSEDVSGETESAALGTLVASPTASGSTISVEIPYGQMHQNELITLTLKPTLKNTSGTALSAPYSISFTTQYSPMYCTERRLRLKIGAYIQDVATDTVNFAIYLASLEAEQMVWNKENLDDEWYTFARAQWTCCRAAQMLLMNTLGGNNSLKSKQLGDLKVEYNTSGDLTLPLKSAEECMAKWESSLVAGGRTIQEAKMVVKGDWDIDKPPVGRGWYHERDWNNSSTPSVNQRMRPFGSRRFAGFHTKKGWWSK